MERLGKHTRRIVYYVDPAEGARLDKEAEKAQRDLSEYLRLREAKIGKSHRRTKAK